MRQDKLKFIKRGTCFVLIFFILTSILLSLPYYIFFMSKEYISLDEGIKLQNKYEEIIFGKAYSDENSLYKLKLVSSTSCDILSLGTSRVMQLRDHFFNKSFCNAGGAIYNIKDATEFLNNTNKDNYPELLLLGLDHNFFHKNWDDERQNFVEANKFFILNTNLLNIYLDFFKNKTDLEKLSADTSKNIGLYAIMKGTGFRNDGSYFYKDIITKNESTIIRISQTMNAVKKTYGADRFVKNVSFNNNAIKELDDLLAYCSDNNIPVIGFLPPFAKEVWLEINNNKENYQYMFEIYNASFPHFEKYDFEFYDYSDLSKINASNCEVIDGYHGSEKAYLRMLINMVEKSSILGAYVDTTYLKNKLKKSEGCFLTSEN